MLSDPSFARAMGAILGLGWVLVTAVVLGTLLGAWVDRRLGTSPWFLIVGALLGTAAGVIHALRVSKRNLK